MQQRKIQRGGSQASASVEATMTPDSYSRLNAMFTNELAQQQGGAAKGKQGKGRGKKQQKGGSQASDAVQQHVPAAAYDEMQAAMSGMIGGAGKKKPAPKKAPAASDKGKKAKAPAARSKAKKTQRGGSLSSDAVLGHMSAAAFAEIDANMGGVLPPAPASSSQQAGGSGKKKREGGLLDGIKKSISEVVKKTVKKDGDKSKAAAKKKSSTAKPPSPAKTGKKKSAAKAKRGQRGGAGSCDGGQDSPVEPTTLFTSETSKVPVANPADSETRFSTCEFKDVLMAPGAVMGPRFDYTLLPQFDGSPFTLPIPAEWQALPDPIQSMR